MAICVGQIVERVRLVAAETSLASVVQSFLADPDSHVLTAVRERKPLGLLQRAAVMELAASSGQAALSSLKVSDVVGETPLRIDAKMAVGQLALEHRGDGYARLRGGVIVTEERRYVGVLTLPSLLKALAEENAARAKAMRGQVAPTAPVSISSAARQTPAEQTQFLLATLAHEIRTPLTGMMGLAEMLAARLPDPENRDVAQTIVQSGESLDRILKDTLDFVSLESGKRKLAPETAVLNDFASELRRLWAGQSARRGLTLSVDVSRDAAAQLEVDLGRVRQVVNNLISNALKFTHEGSVSVCIDTQPVGRQLMLSVEVADTGRGIAEADKDRFFKAFERGEMLKDTPGWGLGLTISHALARHLGGQLTVSDNPGGGSVFTLMVPVSSSKLVVMPTVKARKSGRFTLGEVLVIEDHEACAMVVMEALRQAGWIVRHAHSIAQAEELMARQDFQAILTDLHLVDGTALSMIDRLRHQPGAHQTVPILVMTADIGEGTRQACLAMGADRALNKPIQGPALVATLADALMSRAAGDIVTPLLRGRLAS